MTSPNPDVRHGDRITALAGRARSAYTRKPLTRSSYLDVLHVYPQHDGTVEVYAMELTKRDGTWRTGGPDRTVILTAESYTTPIRERDGAHTERVVNGPTKRQLAAAAYAALLAAQMDPLFELPVAPPAWTDSEPAPFEPAGGRGRIVRDERLPHPSGQFCASCANRATLRLTLETGDQVVTCRPCASRYPR